MGPHVHSLEQSEAANGTTCFFCWSTPPLRLRRKGLVAKVVGPRGTTVGRCQPSKIGSGYELGVSGGRGFLVLRFLLGLGSAMDDDGCVPCWRRCMRRVRQFRAVCNDTLACGCKRKRYEKQQLECRWGGRGGRVHDLEEHDLRRLPAGERRVARLRGKPSGYQYSVRRTFPSPAGRQVCSEPIKGRLYPGNAGWSTPELWLWVMGSRVLGTWRAGGMVSMHRHQMIIALVRSWVKMSGAQCRVCGVRISCEVSIGYNFLCVIGTHRSV